jgi:hypothetical protein
LLPNKIFLNRFQLITHILRIKIHSRKVPFVISAIECIFVREFN